MTDGYVTIKNQDGIILANKVLCSSIGTERQISKKLRLAIAKEHKIQPQYLRWAWYNHYIDVIPKFTSSNW